MTPLALYFTVAGLLCLRLLWLMEYRKDWELQEEIRKMDRDLARYGLNCKMLVILVSPILPPMFVFAKLSKKNYDH